MLKMNVVKTLLKMLNERFWNVCIKHCCNVFPTYVVNVIKTHKTQRYANVITQHLHITFK